MGKTDQLNRIAYIQNWCHDAGFVAWLKDNPDEAPWHYRIFGGCQKFRVQGGLNISVQAERIGLRKG